MPHKMMELILEQKQSEQAEIARAAAAAQDWWQAGCRDDGGRAEGSWWKRARSKLQQSETEIAIIGNGEISNGPG